MAWTILMEKNEWGYPGARWWKFDFHTHTPASRETPWHTITDPSSKLTPTQWLLEYMQAGIDCVAVTDHNTGDWIDLLKHAYQELAANQPEGFRELRVFPGVELSVNGGVHLLAILDTDKKTSDIDGLLARVEYRGTKGDSDGVTQKSLVEVIKIIYDLDALAIPAHVDQAKGLLRLVNPGERKAALDANTLKQVLGMESILAMEVVDSSAPKPQIYEEANCRWTEVIGTDCHSFRGDRVPGSRFTWVKMATPSIEGLRLALLDGAGFSIRRSDAPVALPPTSLPKNFIEKISVAEARYMGRGQAEVLELSPWFNALVGGRGTGKSTIVHALRLAYRREEELERLSEENEARLTFTRFRRAPKSRNDETGALDYEPTKKTEITVTLVRDGFNNRLRWRQDGNGPAVEEMDVEGQWTPSVSQSIKADRFPIRIFSQGQIAALAGENQQALLDLIDGAAQIEPAHQAWKAAKQRFETLRAQIRELEAKLKGRDELDAKLADVRKKLASFEGMQHAEILKAYQLRTRQNREVDRQLDAALQMAAKLRMEAEGLVPEDIPASLFDAADRHDSEAIGIVERLHASVAGAAAAVREVADRLDDSVRQERGVMASTAWLQQSVESRTKYLELIQQLKEQGVADPSEYGQLVQERQVLELEIEQLDSLEKELERLVEEAGKQRKRVHLARLRISEQRRNFLIGTLSENRYVKIELCPYGRSPSVIEKELREALDVRDDRFEADILVMSDDKPERGLVADLLKGLPDGLEDAASFMEIWSFVFGQRLERASAGHGTFGGFFNNYLKNAGERRPEQMDRLLMWSPEDSLKVEYSQSGDGKEFKSILQASAGQRAAAMLAFLLAYGDEPLVLDQPEDDLDNHLIYELVVQQIRNKKMRRQLIVVTHNPNIVVNGDAEMVHALDFRNGQCRVVEKGSLQEKAIREEVCRVMEGGREAFTRRFRRLGQESKHV